MLEYRYGHIISRYAFPKRVNKITPQQSELNVQVVVYNQVATDLFVLH